MFLTHSSRAAADTILAQSRTSTRRLVPHAEHVRSRGRRCAPTTPTWPHVHAIWRSIPETQAASAGAGQAVSGQVRTMVIDWHGRRDRDGRFVALRCVRLLALRCVKAASPTGVPGRTLGTLFLPGATVRLDWPPLCFFQRYGWLLARRLGSTIFRNLAANSSRVSSGRAFGRLLKTARIRLDRFSLAAASFALRLLSLDGAVTWAYSITLSARASNVSGTLTPIALAVLRFYHQLELGRLLDWDVGDLDTVEKLDELSWSDVSGELSGARSIRNEATCLCIFGALHSYATPSTRMSISLRSVTKPIGLVRSASAPFSNALRLVSASP
jgi:hypothetical protein